MKKVVNVKALAQTPYAISEEPQDLLGKGSYGRVVRAYNKNHPERHLVAKIFQLNSLKECRSGLVELSIVGKLPRHPHLVHYEKIQLTSQNHMYIIMEECNGGTLTNYIEKERHLPETEVWRFVREFLRGYRCLYDTGIIHRDIKSDNILIHNGLFKISDFGLAKILEIQNQTSSVKGSPVYIAPELYSRTNTDSRLDVYSFGVTTYYMAYRRYPYTTKQQYKSLEQLIQDTLTSKLVLPEGRSKELEQFLSCLLQKNPQDRVKWAAIFEKYDYLEGRHMQIPTMFQKHQSTAAVELKAVQNSNTDMKDLELLDLNLMMSLRPESVILLNDLERRLIRKRELVVFMDRIRGKLSKFRQPCCAETRNALTRFNFWTISQIKEEMQTTISNMVERDRQSFRDSKSYKIVWKLLEEDSREIHSQMEECSDAGSVNSIKKQIYDLCGDVMTHLIEQKAFKTAMYLSEVEKYLSCSGDSIIGKNQIDSVDNFIQETEGKSAEELEGILRKEYEWLFV